MTNRNIIKDSNLIQIKNYIGVYKDGLPVDIAAEKFRISDLLSLKRKRQIDLDEDNKKWVVL
jgi:hypothetical protein